MKSYRWNFVLKAENAPNSNAQLKKRQCEVPYQFISISIYFN
jgi:hypothetical protein